MNGPGSINRLFRVVWNATLCVWQVASEITRSRGKTKSSRVGGGSNAVWSAVAAGSLMLLGVANAGGLPTDGVITNGTGAISTQGNTMTVQQDTAKMVVDWQSFSIDAGNKVQFQQPSASAAVDLR